MLTKVLKEAMMEPRSKRQRANLLMRLAEEKARVMSGLVQTIHTGNKDRHGEAICESGINVWLDSGENCLRYTYWFRDVTGSASYEYDWGSIRNVLTDLIDQAAYTANEPQPWQGALMEAAG